MAKQYAVYSVSWRDAVNRPAWFTANPAEYQKSAAEALEAKLNHLAQEGWIIEKIIPCRSIHSNEATAFTIVSFK